VIRDLSEKLFDFWHCVSICVKIYNLECSNYKFGDIDNPIRLQIMLLHVWTFSACLCAVKPETILYLCIYAY